MKRFSFCPNCQLNRWGQKVTLPETENTVLVSFTCSRCDHTDNTIKVNTSKKHHKNVKRNFVYGQAIMN